ncbi:hypothetical protein [Kineococcus sp. SYSU DK005]|uniref:hypothetical protein n=1 Tax=Kineococcus sp. SYSU DK005 TaxID=3383126 RepID=UPI003D7E2B1F
MSTEELAQALLVGPRGRRLLSALVHEATRAGGAEPWTWPAWGQDDLAPLSESLLQRLRQRLGQAVAAMDLGALAAREDPRQLLTALADAVCSARYWQEPDTEDQALADAGVARQLRPLARAVATSAAAACWSQPVDLSAQQHLSWLCEGRDRYQLIVPGAEGAASSQSVASAALGRWREEAAAEEERCRLERPRDAGANWSGTWWSSPPRLPELLLSTPVLPATAGTGGPAAGAGAGSCAGGSCAGDCAAGDSFEVGKLDSRRQVLPVGMTLLEDEPGIEEVHARAVRLRQGVRVYEVHDAQAWCELVAAHPRSVTFSRRQNWWRATGWDGAWVLPDWASVASNWDGVHLSVRGYLALSGRLLQTALGWEVTRALVGADVEGVRPGAARTLLAGWSPGQTYWLTDVVQQVGQPVLWCSREEDYPLRWTPRSDAAPAPGSGGG